MASQWEQRWRPVDGMPRLHGGQGRSLVAEPLDGSGGRVFIKELNRPKDRLARKRFVREVTAYETLQADGLPRLVAHNAPCWRDPRIPLYLVLDYIEGVTLGDQVRNGGPLNLTDALTSIDAIGTTLEQCHADEVVHRDIKPANVMLRDGDPSRPVLVDFGLSFNDLDADQVDITRVGEEVGNRFLRLPEHAWGGRDAVSDVTQLAGLLLFALTGVEPRVLSDADNNKPHQRAAVATQLDAICQGRVRLRLLSLFDRAFDQRVSARYGSVADFRAALAAVAAPETDDDGGIDALLARLDEVSSQPAHLAAASNARRLGQYVRLATIAVQRLAEQRQLTMSQSGQQVEAAAEIPYGRTSLTLLTHGAASGRQVVYRFELRGPTDVVLLADDLEIWRGPDGQADAVAEAVQRRAIEAFLAGPDPDPAG
jgi:hypothetical protein